MYEVFVDREFSAAHRLSGYKGKCEELHGHNWLVRVYVGAKELNEIGLAIDFHDVKMATDEILIELDHKNLNELSYFTRENPSSENIARFIYQRLSERINSDKAKVTRVRVMETSTAGVDYSE